MTPRSPSRSTETADRPLRVRDYLFAALVAVAFFPAVNLVFTIIAAATNR